jgi:hypothetical protein
MGRKPKTITRADLDRMCARPVEHIEKRYHYREAFISSPKLKLRTVQVLTIGDGIAILEALGEGKLMVSTKVRDPKVGYFPMAKCALKELIGKTKQEIYNLLDTRTDGLKHK